MNPAYAQRVETQEYFAPPGVFPLTTAGLIPKLISHDEIHVKEFPASTIYREMDAFFQRLHEEYGEYQVIETLELEKTILLVYAVPRRMAREPCRFYVR